MSRPQCLYKIKELKYYVKNRYLRRENKVNENEVVSYRETLRYMQNIIENNLKSCSPLCQTYKPISFQTRFPKKWARLQEQVVNPRHQTPQWQSGAKPGTLLLNILIKKPKNDKTSPEVTCSNQYSKRMSWGGNIQGGTHLQNQKYLVTESLNL